MYFTRYFEKNILSKLPGRFGKVILDIDDEYLIEYLRLVSRIHLLERSALSELKDILNLNPNECGKILQCSRYFIGDRPESFKPKEFAEYEIKAKSVYKGMIIRIEFLYNRVKERNDIIRDLEKELEEKNNIISDLQKESEKNDSQNIIISTLQKELEKNDSLNSIISYFQKELEKNDSLNSIIRDLQKELEEKNNIIKQIQLIDKSTDKKCSKRIVELDSNDSDDLDIPISKACSKSIVELDSNDSNDSDDLDIPISKAVENNFAEKSNFSADKLFNYRLKYKLSIKITTRNYPVLIDLMNSDFGNTQEPFKYNLISELKIAKNGEKLCLDNKYPSYNYIYPEYKLYDLLYNKIKGTTHIISGDSNQRMESHFYINNHNADISVNFEDNNFHGWREDDYYNPNNNILSFPNILYSIEISKDHHYDNSNLYELNKQLIEIIKDMPIISKKKIKIIIRLLYYGQVDYKYCDDLLEKDYNNVNQIILEFNPVLNFNDKYFIKTSGDILSIYELM
jgi:hypothetical protein